MRDQVVTLFRFARAERYLPKDRTTEAEDVAKMKVARKTVDMFTPAELQIIIENTRKVWLPWVLISAYAGVRTFEVLRMDWAMMRWEQKLIDLPPVVTKDRLAAPEKGACEQSLPSLGSRCGLSALFSCRVSHRHGLSSAPDSLRNGERFGTLAVEQFCQVSLAHAEFLTDLHGGED